MELIQMGREFISCSPENQGGTTINQECTYLNRNYNSYWLAGRHYVNRGPYMNNKIINLF